MKPLLPKTIHSKRDPERSPSQALKNAIINIIPPFSRFLKKSNNINIIIVSSGIILIILSYTILDGPSSQSLSGPLSSSSTSLSSDDSYPLWYEAALKYYKQMDGSTEKMESHPTPTMRMEL
jgi:hypothetical protein